MNGRIVALGVAGITLNLAAALGLARLAQRASPADRRQCGEIDPVAHVVTARRGEQQPIRRNTPRRAA